MNKIKTAGSLLVGSNDICENLTIEMNRLAKDKYELAKPYFDMQQKYIMEYMNKYNITYKDFNKKDYQNCMNAINRNENIDIDKILSNVEFIYYYKIPCNVSPNNFIKNMIIRSENYDYIQFVIEEILGDKEYFPEGIIHFEIGYSLKEIFDKHLYKFDDLYYIVGIELVTYKAISHNYYNPTMMLFNGKLEYSENYLDASIRETREEAGLNIGNIYDKNIQNNVRFYLNANLPLSVSIHKRFGSSFYLIICLLDSFILHIPDTISFSSYIDLYYE